MIKLISLNSDGSRNASKNVQPIKSSTSISESFRNSGVKLGPRRNRVKTFHITINNAELPKSPKLTERESFETSYLDKSAEADKNRQSVKAPCELKDFNIEARS